MTIKRITVKNLKSFKELQIDLGKFNVLIGANASGKSNFIRIIEFLRDIARHGLENAISLQGGPEYLTNLNIGVGENLSVEILLSEIQTPVAPTVGRSKDKEGDLGLVPLQITYSLFMGFQTKAGAFELLDERLILRGDFLATKEGSESPDQTLGPGEVVITRGAGVFRVKISPPAGLALESYDVDPWFHGLKAPSRTTILDYGPFFLDPGLEDIAIYDIDPKLPKKGTPITGKAELEEDGSNLAIVLKKILESESKTRKLKNLLTDLLPFVADLNVEKFADKSLLFTLRETFTKKEYLPASLISDGTINIAALIVALYFEEKPVAVIEEPERNIHPHLISRVAGMMKDASRQKQIIVTTHNPEIVRNVELGDVLLVSRDAEGYSTITRPSEKEDVKVFLQNEMGLEELFVQNLLHP